jgi:hypothetical protein
MKYNWKVVLQSNNAQARNIRTEVKVATITDVINRLRAVKLLLNNSILSITRTPLS